MVRNLLLMSLMMGITHQAIGKLVAVSDGGLYVYGNVRESACRLEMDSAWQAVKPGETTHAEINAVGKQPAPVQIKLYLLVCPEIATRMTNSNSMKTMKRTPDVKASRQGFEQKFWQFTEQNYFFAARSKEATISALAASAFSHPSTFTHLPFSRSL